MGPPRGGKAGWEHRAQALLWVGDTLRAVGSDGEVRAEAARLGIAPEDLGGRVVLPGFVDAHTHFLHVGVKRTRPDLRGAASLREALDRLAAFLREHPGRHHVIGEGWDESAWPGGRRPTRRDLDAVVAAAARHGDGPSDRPVVLRRICGHVAVASSGALPRIRARWDDDVAVDLDSGLLLEAPSLYLNEVLPSAPQELDRAVQKACEVAHRLGVTAVGDYSQAPYRAALQRAAARGTLTVRVASSVYVQQLDDEAAAGFRTGRPGLAPEDLAPAARRALGIDLEHVHGVEAREHVAPRPGRDGGDAARGGRSAWLRDGGLKVFLDGSLGGHTAHLREPYLDLPAAGGKAAGAGRDPHAGHGHGPAGTASALGGPEGRGTRVWGDEQLDHFFGTAHARGVQVHAHAIGDAAIDQGLEAFGRLAAREDLEGRGWLAERLPREPGSPAAGGHGGLGGVGGGAGAGSAKEGKPALEPKAGGASPEGGGGALRHRFEHFEIAHDDQIARAVELGLVASSQPNFVGEWSAKGGMYEARLGERYRLNNRFRAFAGAGLPLAFGSDGMPFGPLVGLQAAVEHPDAAQRLSIEEAVWHYTTAAAWSLHWEDEVGALVPGMKADLVVLEQRDLAIAPTQWILHEAVSGGVPRGGNRAPIPSL